MLPHLGSLIVCQVRSAFSRHSSSHAGSCFLAEMSRTVSSVRPRGTASCSMSVTNPYLYSRPASCSMVCVDVLISLLRLVRSARLQRDRVGSLRSSTLNEIPHPQVAFARGLLIRNPLLNRFVS